MVPSSADIVLQNRRISQSETSTINICDLNVATTCFTEIAEIAQRKMLYFRFLRLLSNVSVFVL